MDSIKEVDIVITTSYTPNSTSIQFLRKTLDSVLKSIGPKNDSLSFNLIIAVDGLNPAFKSSINIRRRQKWLKKIHKITIDEGVVIVNPEWGHLSGLLNYTVKHFCNSKFLFIVQDDLMFIKPIPIIDILNSIETEDSVKHIRFNKRRTEIAGLDTEISEVEFNGISLVKTNNWSDNNYVTTLSHFNEVLSPSLANVNCFPENIFRPLNISNPELLGTYIYGKIADSASITHLGSIRGRLRARYFNGPFLKFFPWVYYIVEIILVVMDFLRKFFIFRLSKF